MWMSVIPLHLASKFASILLVVICVAVGKDLKWLVEAELTVKVYIMPVVGLYICEILLFLLL